jgi:hypothetical protein
VPSQQLLLGVSALAHRLWVCIEALLHSLKQMLVLPP